MEETRVIWWEVGLLSAMWSMVLMCSWRVRFETVHETRSVRNIEIYLACVPSFEALGSKQYGDCGVYRPCWRRIFVSHLLWLVSVGIEQWFVFQQ